jgi:hypothetical protein
MNLTHQPGGHPKGDDVESSGEFIEAMVRIGEPFDREAWREQTLRQLELAGRGVGAKSRKGRR